jgi:hypothetical protein
MKYISTEVQRHIMFIPGLNLCNFFIAVLNCRKASDPTAMGFKVGIRTFCILLPITFLGGILSSLFPQLENLFFLCSIYIGPVCMSHGLIKLQEKYFS